MEFSKGFLFGSAVSSYQAEGNASGERKTDWDVYLQKNPHKNLCLPQDLGPNWWIPDVAEMDLKSLSSLGLNAQRFGIEWARIVPEEGKTNTGAIRRYREIIGRMKLLGLRPMCTLNHFTLPYWVAEFGGWENPKISKAFKDYTEIIAYEFGDILDWVTINEPNQTIDMGYIFGSWPPGKKFRIDKFFQVTQNMRKAHQNAFEVLKKNIPGSRVGVANALKLLKPQNPGSFLDCKVTEIANYLENNKLLDLNRDVVDFIGVNYYHSYLLKFKPTLSLTLRKDAEGVIKTAPFLETVKPENFESDAGWSVTPDFFYELLLNIYEKYNKPIIVTENGIADDMDKLGAFYLLSHLIAEANAIKKGVVINGHFYWSSIDTEEWMLGYKYKFGLIKLDHKTGERKIRDRAKLYGEIANSGKIDLPTLSSKYLSLHQKKELKNLLKI